MKIVNSNDIEQTDLRRDLLAIAEEGLEAIDTRHAIRSAVRIDGDTLHVAEETSSLADANRIFVVGVGKCSVDACQELEQILGERLTGGIVLDIKDPNACHFEKLTCMQGTHPMPTDANVEASRKIVELLEETKEDDIVIYVISGGGSTLLCLPDGDGTCEDEKAVVGALMKAGVKIQEMNTIRKHTSLARGGYLAKHAYPAKVISLIFSDVPGNDIEFIASGPTVKDTTSIEDAESVIERHGILEMSGLSNIGLIETPKEDKYFERVQNIMIVNNDLALMAMSKKADSLGYDAEICDSCLVGEARVVGEDVAKALQKKEGKKAMLYGGETTVTITGDGVGGRNQELTLSALLHIQEDQLVCGFASDGRDNGDAAGAIADAITQRHVQEKGLDPKASLLNNDALTFFAASGDAIITGVTGSNVADFVIALKK